MLDPLIGVLALVALLGMILASMTAMVLGGGPQVLQMLGKVIVEILKNLGK